MSTAYCFNEVKDVALDLLHRRLVLSLLSERDVHSHVEGIVVLGECRCCSSCSSSSERVYMVSSIIIACLMRYSLQYSGPCYRLSSTASRSYRDAGYFVSAAVHVDGIHLEFALVDRVEQKSWASGRRESTDSRATSVTSGSGKLTASSYRWTAPVMLDRALVSEQRASLTVRSYFTSSHARRRLCCDQALGIGYEFSVILGKDLLSQG